MTKASGISVALESLKLRQSLQVFACVPLVLSAALAASAAQAQEAAASTEVAAAETTAEMGSLEEVIVTGTRRVGLEVSESPAPIQVLSAETLKSSGATDLIGSLAATVPSFTAQAFGGDMANQTLSAKLRGLSPNHALVLVNGKRRHTTSSLAVLGGPYQGGASADLNFIPVSAIERIEVLTDGAAAQYGTDAIAGVVNIILKKNYSGGLVDGTVGAYKDGGGDTTGVSGNAGLGDENAFFNFTAEVRNHAASDRGGIDPRVNDPARLASYPNSNMALARGYPYLNHILGDSEYHLQVAMFNAGAKLGGIDLYSFGSYGKKKAESYENYRLPSRVSHTSTDSNGDTTKTYLYPFGFSPKEASDEDDLSLTVGAKGELAGWMWDAASTYGKDQIKVYTLNSANASLYADTGATPTDFYDGRFFASQWTNTLDIGKDFDVGMATPLNVALGIEQRRETYEIGAGDPASRYKEGGQSFPGYALTDAGKHNRDNYAIYADFAVSPVAAWQLDAAVRYEHFSDFGSTTVGKLTSRYDFTDALALRGTVSTGFRAPTLAEEYYSATNVGPSTAFVQLPPNAPAAAALGLGDGLQPEKSTNFSLGIVAHPIERLTMTLDAYQIEIRDRVVGTGTLFGSGGSVNSPAVNAAIAANGNFLDPDVVANGQTGINIFTNGIDTRTRGVDLVMTFPTSYDWGNIDWTASANYNKTEVTKIRATPTELAGQPLFDATAISDLETTAPKYRVNLGAVWTYEKFAVKLQETLYGPSSEMESPDGGTYYENKIKATPVTDLELTFKPVSSVKFSVGANNLFNTYPDQKNGDLLAAYRADGNNSAVTIYPTFSPFGINGAYYYAKLGYTF